MGTRSLALAELFDVSQLKIISYIHEDSPSRRSGHGLPQRTVELSDDWSDVSLVFILDECLFSPLCCGDGIRSDTSTTCSLG